MHIANNEDPLVGGGEHISDQPPSKYYILESSQSWYINISNASVWYGTIFGTFLMFFNRFYVISAILLSLENIYLGEWKSWGLALESEYSLRSKN